MTNQEIIALELEALGEEGETVEELLTFLEWKKRGYSVNKGETAFIKVQLWKPIMQKVKETDENGKEKEVKKKRFKLVMTALFTQDQVSKQEKKTA